MKKSPVAMSIIFQICLISLNQRRLILRASLGRSAFVCVIVAIIFSVARPVLASVKPHPSVARIVVPERGGASLGSGTLVAVTEQYGLVLTNWHVVRDGNGKVVVVFPSGFRSGAVVVKMDQDWDLAALAIQRPPIVPVPIASQIPRPGDRLAIAGYGSGEYRIVGGKCVQYLSPGGRLPFELIELSAGARQGDSGGPILNWQGELAGVLFGSAWGKTSGSHCGRVRQFVSSLPTPFNSGILDRVPIRGNRSTMLAEGGNNQWKASNPNARSTSVAKPVAAIVAGQTGSSWKAGSYRQSGARQSGDPTFGNSNAGQKAASPDSMNSDEPAAGIVWWDYLKNALAAIGAAAVLIQLSRWLA
jgi:serine protease Do